MMIKNEELAVIENLSQELRRGILVLAALSQLSEPRYGYALMDRMAERGLEIEQGTIYPLLRRLESQGLLESEWDVGGSRPRRYYVLSTLGMRVLESLTEEWGNLNQIMSSLLDKSSNGG